MLQFVSNGLYVFISLFKAKHVNAAKHSHTHRLRYMCACVCECMYVNYSYSFKNQSNVSKLQV